MKLERINKEIEKATDKIVELQGRLKELEQQKTEAENTEILALARSIELTPAELGEFIRSFRDSGRPPAALTERETQYLQEEPEDDE